MVGGGPFGLKPGEWTDDTSMALCLAESLLTHGRFDPVDQLERYVGWFRKGHLSSNGTCFDIGNTTRQALTSFMRTGNPRSGPTGTYGAGNGSIMRLAPVVLFFFPDNDAIDRYSAASSLTTHGAAEAVDSCRLVGGILCALLKGQAKEEAVRSVAPAPWMSDSLAEIASATYQSKSVDEVHGTGYAVACLEAALWCFVHTDSFREAILEAVNLGDDADTTAAVCGQLAGAYYGRDSIPSDWLSRLAMRDVIAEWAERLVTAAL
jgi:ADP-ribosyl-[dinitrogen reductase] hydrolase